MAASPPLNAPVDPAPPGMLVIISGPSGVGKSTITNAIVQRLDAALSISMTTRPRAATDVDGQHYHFVDEATFRKAIADDQLLEWAEVYGNLYGTPRSFVERNLQSGRLVVLEIDVKGARQVRQKMPEAFAVFILAPTDEALLHRLRSRQRDDEATIQRRFSRAQVEIADARSAGMYRFVVNDQFDRAVDEVASLIEQEQRRRAHAMQPAGTQH